MNKLLPVISHYHEVADFVTKDASIIRELMHPISNAVRNQSLAEAIVPAGATTFLHHHVKSEEIYFILQGSGDMQLGDGLLKVVAGDTIVIAPGTWHNIKNTGNETLKILCSCSPPYSHEDTVLADN